MGLISWLRTLLGSARNGPEWSVATGDEDGHPLVVRTRVSAPQGMSLASYPATLELVWRFDGEDNGGMPPSDLLPRLDQFEDLIGAFEGPANGLLGITITGNGRREWVWYVADSDSFAARVQTAISASSTPCPVQVRKGR